VTQKEGQRKGLRTKGSPEEEREALIQFYQTKGFERQSAESIAERVKARIEASTEFTLGEQLGLIFEEDWPPSKAGLLTGLSFLVASLVPILPFAFLSVNPAAITAMVASVGSLFAIGASKAIFTRQNWLRSGLEVMAIGTLAAAVTYLIGLVIPI
jgi:VIT1/CCC1 family predicted Fe2+/Mn2+ transporter